MVGRSSGHPMALHVRAQKHGLRVQCSLLSSKGERSFENHFPRPDSKTPGLAIHQSVRLQGRNHTHWT